MELSKVTDKQSISRSEVYPVHKDYRALLDQAYTLIASYSGVSWTNYNDSDPGITILQNLCYALTELGNKAELPICDLLTNEDGKICLDHQFHTAEQVFPMNPVTLPDFCKLLINAIPELKQVYFTNSELTTSLRCQVEVKPEYITNINSNLSFSDRIEEQAKILLLRHGNMTQVFTRPSLLSPLLLGMQGTIVIAKEVIIEKAIATIIHTLNNCLSPYPIHQSYVALVNEGADLANLLKGPFLSEGYIADENIAVKRSTIKVQELNGCLAIECVIESQLSMIMLEGIDKKPVDHVDISIDEVPYFSIDSFANLHFVQNGKPIREFDNTKINFYLNQLIPVPQSESLNDLLPQGSYHDIASYYSIQNSFPTVYQLTGKGPVERVHQAKVRQLKAYLFLFEQIMGDYLAQLKNIPNLFSFESGRSDYQLTSATYFTQPLYTVPGIERVLTGVDGSRYAQGRFPTSVDWQSYQQDPTNPYATILATKASSTENNLTRKLRSMEHLLARYGKQFEHQPLHFANPNYGSDLIAEVEYLKQTLRTFPLVSANQIRTYFKSHPNATLACGLELNLENDLGLSGFFTGICESIQQGLEQQKAIEIIYYNETGGREVIFPKPSKDWAKQLPITKCNWVEVSCNNEILLSFHTQETLSPMNAVEANKFLQPYLTVLQTLAEKHNGMVVIDFSRLTDTLFFRWSLKSNNGTLLYSSDGMSFDRLQKRLLLLEQSQTFEIKEVNPGLNYEIGTKTNQHRYVLCNDLHSKDEAQTILDRITNLNDTFNDAITIEISDKTGSSVYPLSLFMRSVTVFLPEWVTAFQQTDYQKLIQGKLIALSAPSAVSDLCLLPMDDFKKLLTTYNAWMNGLDQLYEGRKPEQEALRATVDLTTLLATQL